MKEKEYLIPANTKKAQLIFSMFNPFDLILFGSGLTCTLLMFLLMPIEEALYAIIALLPAAITFFLVMPVPNYHNVMHVIGMIIVYLSKNQKFKWRGWCMYDKVKDFSEKKEYKIY